MLVPLSLSLSHPGVMMVGLIFDMYLGGTKIEQRGLKWDPERRDIRLVSRGWGKKLQTGEGG